MFSKTAQIVNRQIGDATAVVLPQEPGPPGVELARVQADRAARQAGRPPVIQKPIDRLRQVHVFPPSIQRSHARMAATLRRTHAPCTALGTWRMCGPNAPPTLVKESL